MTTEYKTPKYDLDGYARDVTSSIVSKIPFLGVVYGPLVSLFWGDAELGPPPITKAEVTKIIDVAVSLNAARVWAEIVAKDLMGWQVTISTPFTEKANKEKSLIALQVRVNERRPYFTNPIKDFTPEQHIVVLAAFANFHLSLLTWGASVETNNEDSEKGITKGQVEDFTMWLKGPVGKYAEYRQNDYEKRIKALSEEIITIQKSKLGVIEQYYEKDPTGKEINTPRYHWKNPLKDSEYLDGGYDRGQLEPQWNAALREIETRCHAEHGIFLNHVREVNASTICYAAYADQQSETTDSYEPNGVLRQKEGSPLWYEEVRKGKLLLPAAGIKLDAIGTRSTTQGLYIEVGRVTAGKQEVHLEPWGGPNDTFDFVLLYPYHPPFLQVMKHRVKWEKNRS